MYSLMIFFTIVYLDFAHPDCIYPNISKSYGHIQSAYLKNYYYSDCFIWVIELGYYNVLEIRIESVDIAPDEYINIHDGSSQNSPILIKLYGKLRFRKLTTSSGSALIHYRKQFIGRQSTFNLTYQIKGVCIPGIQNSCSEGELNCYDVRYERCNSFWNCPLSGKDEENCSPCKAQIMKTKTMHYPCSQFQNSECYSHRQRCDGVQDCPSLTDETYCDPVQCGAHNKTFLCQTFPSRCISESLRCDGMITCRDGSDEHKCSVLMPYYNSSHIRIILVSSVSVILCLLMLVLGFLCICRLHKMRILTTRNLARRRGYLSLYDSSIQQLVDDQMRRGPPPPNYNYALCHSRPFKSIVDLQKIIRSQSKVSENKSKHYVNSCQYSNTASQEVLQTTNSVSDDPFESDVQLLVPDNNTDNSGFNNNQSDVDLIDPGVVEDDPTNSARSVKC